MGLTVYYGMRVLVWRVSLWRLGPFFWGGWGLVRGGWVGRYLGGAIVGGKGFNWRVGA